MKTLDAENRGPWSARRDVAGPGLVVVEVAAADEETVFAFQVPQFGDVAPLHGATASNGRRRVAVSRSASWG
ncbi:DUF6207 family protein [Streptomyces sp. NPDC000888]